MYGHGFRLSTKGKAEIEAFGPGMSSSKQPPLVGVSYLRISVNDATLSVEATLGGVKKMQLFVFLFPPGLIAFLILVGGMRGNFVPSLTWGVLPWLVIAPLLALWMSKRTEKALDVLMANMADAANAGAANALGG